MDNTLALALFAQIAEGLHGKLVKPRKDYGGTFAEVELPDGVRFHLSAGGYSREGRIEFSGSWPTYAKHDGTRHTVIPRDVWVDGKQLTSPSITASLARPVEQIVKDAERRFLPNYRVVWFLCKERADATTESYRSQREVVEAAAAATGGTANREFTGISYGYEFGEARHHGGYGDTPHSFEVTLREVSPELLDGIVHFVRNWRKA